MYVISRTNPRRVFLPFFNPQVIRFLFYLLCRSGFVAQPPGPPGPCLIPRRNRARFADGRLNVTETNNLVACCEACRFLHFWTCLVIFQSFIAVICLEAHETGKTVGFWQIRLKHISKCCPWFSSFVFEQHTCCNDSILSIQFVSKQS